MKWFQNHSYLNRKLCSDVKAKKTTGNTNSTPGVSDSADDEEAVTLHLTELKKEVKKNRPDDSKLARLLSLTYTSRRNDLIAQTANARISALEYPCLKKPVFVSSVNLYDSK